MTIHAIQERGWGWREKLTMYVLETPETLSFQCSQQGKHDYNVLEKLSRKTGG